jgi:hypothetical protein
MRMFAAPLIIFGPQVNLITMFAASPRQAARQIKVSGLIHTTRYGRTVAA